MSAEIDYLNQQVQSLKHELEVQAALYLDKMKRHQHKAIWLTLIWACMNYSSEYVYSLVIVYSPLISKVYHACIQLVHTSTWISLVQINIMWIANLTVLQATAWLVHVQIMMGLTLPSVCIFYINNYCAL